MLSGLWVWLVHEDECHYIFVVMLHAPYLPSCLLNQQVYMQRHIYGSENGCNQENLFLSGQDGRLLKQRTLLALCIIE